MGVLRSVSGGLVTALICAAGGAGGQDMSHADLTRPADAYQGQLPSLDELVNPPDLDRFQDIARDIAGSSAASTMKTIRHAAAERGVLEEADDGTGNSSGTTRLPQPYRATVLVSASLGESSLKALFAAYHGRADIRFAFRGIPNGQTIPDFAVWLQTLLPEQSDANIVLDPEAFDMVPHDVVPIVLIEDQSRRAKLLGELTGMGEIVAQAIGLSNVQWVFDRYQQGETHIRQTTTHPVTEEDLRHRISREAQAQMDTLTTDPDILVNRYWDRRAQELTSLAVPPASMSKREPLFFAYIAPETIYDDDGRILAHAGEAFRPSDLLPFDRQVLVFDPTSDAELQFVEDRLSRTIPGVAARVLIVTKMPPAAPGEERWGGLQALIDRFGVRVYLLEDSFQQSFRITATPTEIIPETIDGKTEVISYQTAL